jgi:hypothetical protein
MSEFIKNLSSNPAFIVSLSVFILAWLTFRFSISAIRKSLLSGLREEIDLIGRWIGNSYDENSNSKKWYNPLYMVIGLNRSFGLQAFFSNAYLSLLGKNLLISLTTLNQGIGRFNQHLQRYLDFVSNHSLSIKAYNIAKADLKNVKISQNDIYCKIQESKQKNSPYSKEIAEFLEYVYTLNKALHVDGIGTYGYYSDPNGKQFPTPYQSFILADKALVSEESKRYFSWENRAWLFADFAVLAIIVFSIWLISL